MVSLVLRNLEHDRGRLAASVGGVALSVVLVLLLAGIYYGFLEQSSAYVTNAGGDVWVMQKGSKDMSHSMSLVPAAAAPGVAAVEGVAAVTPLYARALETTIGGTPKDLFVIGYDPSAGMGGPWRIVEGRGIEGRDEVVIDRVFAEGENLALGGTVRILERDFRIVGITRDASAFIATYAFIHGESAREVLNMETSVNFLLVRTASGASPATVSDRIEAAIPGVSVLTRAEFEDTNGKEIREGFTPILLAIAGIGFTVALAVVSITVYSAVNERLGEFGVLKAIGAEDAFLYRNVAAQSLVAALIGYVVGIPLYYAAAWALVKFVPVLAVATRWEVVGGMLLAVVLMALVASLLPVRRVAKIDPADVFRGWQ